MLKFVLLSLAIAAATTAATAEERDQPVVILRDVVVNEDLKQACFEFKLRHLGFKKDFYEVEYTVHVEHYSEKNEDGNDEPKRTLTLRSSDNLCSAMAFYDGETDQHTTYLCGRIQSAVEDVISVRGVLKLASGNYTRTLGLNKETLIGIDLPANQTRSRERTVNKDLCKVENCQYCRPSCTALFHDTAQVVCDERLTNVFASSVPLSLRGGGVYFPNSKTLCVNGHAAPRRQYKLFGMVRNKHVNSVCRSTSDDAGDLFVCLASDIHTLLTYPFHVYKVQVRTDRKFVEYPVKTTLDLHQMEFNVSERILPSSTNDMSCSTLVEADWYVPFKKKKVPRR